MICYDCKGRYNGWDLWNIAKVLIMNEWDDGRVNYFKLNGGVFWRLRMYQNLLSFVTMGCENIFHVSGEYEDLKQKLKSTEVHVCGCGWKRS